MVVDRSVVTYDMKQDRKTQAVAIWIFTGVGMLVVQVLLGGITRLTGSGLSITEWNPIMGAVPPVGDVQWQQTFEKYQQIAQFKYLNQNFTLADFKFIFFWEWFHRLWARLIGVAFLIPFIFFLVKQYFKSWMVVPLVILFMLGALQGAIGWIMVQSGLNDNDLYVSHIRLAIHFMAAMVLISYALVFGLRLLVPQQQFVYQPAMFTGAVIILVLICCQLVFGAFMAGLKAAATAPTWPTINGMVIPAGLFKNNFWHQLIYDKITVHFVHRTLAYLIAIYVIIWWYKSRSMSYSPAFNTAKSAGFILVILQVVLGIVTVVTSPQMRSGIFGTFETLALLHQLTGMLLLLSFVTIGYLLAHKKVLV